MSSLIDCYSDLAASLGVVTETWLTDGSSLDEDIEDLALGAGLKMICKNREVNERGFLHGGISIIYKEEAMVLKEVALHNPRKFEVLLATGSVCACPRRVAVVACYLPPNYTVPRAREFMQMAAGAVTEAKRRFDDPLIWREISISGK